MARIKMTTARYRAMRRAAMREINHLDAVIDILTQHGNAERRLAEVQIERGILLNAIDALDSQFPRQAAEATEQALRKEME